VAVRSAEIKTAQIVRKRTTPYLPRKTLFRFGRTQRRLIVPNHGLANSIQRQWAHGRVRQNGDNCGAAFAEDALKEKRHVGIGSRRPARRRTTHARRARRQGPVSFGPFQNGTYATGRSHVVAVLDRPSR
jgi:hypothetical protein